MYMYAVEDYDAISKKIFIQREEYAVSDVRPHDPVLTTH